MNIYYTQEKIGLLTYHHTTNFGSLLQTYALYRTVIGMGYSCEIVDYRNIDVEKREFSKKIYECNSLREAKNLLQYGKYKKKKAKGFSAFIQHNFNVSPIVFFKHNISGANCRYDRFLVGSDLVWDFSINGHDTTYMLDFVEDGKGKIAFASSVGKIWNKEDIDEVQMLLNRFDAIGVREKAIENELNKILARKVDFVCDPTMLLTSAEWEKMACERMIKEEYVLCYMSNDGHTMYRDANYGKKHHMPVYLISHDWVPDSMMPGRPYKVEEFLSMIRYADTVFTASYHGMLFSLYFNKNFYYYNRGWSERMRSLAFCLDLMEREKWSIEKDGVQIDYSSVNLKINELRSFSIDKLASYLEKRVEE